MQLKKILDRDFNKCHRYYNFREKTGMKTGRHIIYNSDIKYWWWQAQSDGYAGARAYV